MAGESAIATQSIPFAGSKLDALASIYSLVADDFRATNALIPGLLTSDVSLVEEIGQYIIESGGKRLRPLMVLLASRGCGRVSGDHIRLAVIIEFLHTATLLHDDVVDRSDMRRGRATANATWGNAPSVLVGDFLYSRAFELMVQLGDLRILSILSEATNGIAEGEVLQLANVGNCQISEAQYMEVIRRKTALLFQAATHTAGVLASNNSAVQLALRDFGLHFGLAYQLVDDWLDYAGAADAMGKNVGDDLAEGKLTLPLIQALDRGDAAQTRILRDAISARSLDALPAVLNVVRQTGALDYTQERARTESRKAIACLEALPDTEYRDALDSLARFAVARLT